METSPTDPKLRPRYYYSDRHPFYFGNALNMARHNAYMILNELFEQFGRDRSANPVSEESLAGALQGFYKKKPADWQSRFAGALAAHFPFLACPESLPDPARPELPPPGQPQGQEVVDRLAAALRTLHQLRNVYSHAHHPAPFGALAPLQYLFDYGARELLPRRFGRFRPEDLLHLRQSSETDGFRYRLHDAATGAYTEKGLAFFICLFLERRYAFRFLSRLEGFKKTDTEWARATLQCFALYCCRLPRPRLESSDILLDMLNELGRCPDKLYHCLSDTDRRRFNFAAAAEPAPEPEETGTPMKRYDNRFPYFALRYFDDARAFGRLRFQLQLASLVLERYPKTIDGIERERMLLEPLRVFGRWSDFTAAKMPPHWKTGPTAERVWQFAPHYNLDGGNIPLKIVQDPDRIGFPPLEKRKAEQPDAILSTQELHNLFLYDYLHRRKGWIEKTPEDYILDYRRRFRQLLDDVQSGRLKPAALPPDYHPARVGKYKKPERERLPEHIAFLERSLPNESDPKRRRQKEEDLRKSKTRLAELERYDARKAALAPEIAEKYGIRLQDLPDAVREHLMGFRQLSLKNKTIEKLSALLKDTQKRLEVLSKHHWGKLKVGDVATWIARDLLLFKPHRPDGKGMPNSDEYNTLQAKIAYFPVHKPTLTAFFADQGLTGRDAYTHPFLHEVDLNRCHSVFDFYSDYLKMRQRWLNKALGTVKPRDKAEKPLSDGEIDRRYGYFLQIKNKPLHEKVYAADSPLYLPKGFFNPPILAAMHRNGYPIDPAKDNAVHALALLLEGDTQGFYTEYTRLVHVPDEREWVEKERYMEEIKAEIARLSQWKKRNDEEEGNYRSLKSEENRIYEREQAIRFAQSTDRALWIMSQERAGTRFNDLAAREFNEFRLRDVGFDRLAAAENETGKNVLDLSVPVELPYRIAGQDREIIITDTLPIKRHGDFRRFLKDRRIEDLLAYLSADCAKISRPELEAEIETYDQRREAFFEKIYRFEAAVFERFGESFPPLSGEKTCYNHFDYLSVIEQNAPAGIFDPLGLDKTCELRNKLCHNEIPAAADFSALIEVDDSKQIAARLFDLADRTYDTIMEKLHIELHIETHTDELA